MPKFDTVFEILPKTHTELWHTFMVPY